MDNAELVAENAKLRELLMLAVADIPRICETCSVEKRVDKDCYCNKELKTFSFDSWQWQHADKLKELGILQDKT